MSANDDDEGIRRETRFMDVVLKSGKPYLGICLGAQILVNHLGGRVATRDDGAVEIGWYGLEATPAGQEMMDWPSMVYQFHREGFDLPGGAELLATADVYPNQAFRYGDNAWAIQFHAELTLAMMHRWAVRGAHRFVLPGAQHGRSTWMAGWFTTRRCWNGSSGSWTGFFLPLQISLSAARLSSASLSSDWICLSCGKPKLQARATARVPAPPITTAATGPINAPWYRRGIRPARWRRR
jgi:GMP synthase (glutamine-hydrolysing)